MIDWTVEQIEALAPDASALKASRKLAQGAVWSALACNERALWGLCKGSGKTPYQTRIDLTGPAFKCSCPSRKFPCKHGLALFLLYADATDTFSKELTPPGWVDDWLQTREKKAQQKSTPKPAKKESTQTREKRAQRIQLGLDNLELWLQDLLRAGLATAPRKPYQFWQEAAARLVDAQAPGLATMVRDCSGISATGDGWPERLLSRLARIHLLIQSYRRIDTLPPGLQADVSGLVGIVQSRDEVLQNEGITDAWRVLGQIEEDGDNLLMQRIWLQGIRTGRQALLLNYAPHHMTGQLDRSWLTGMTVEATLAFYTAAWPLRALVKERRASLESINKADAFPTLSSALRAYQSALIMNPWLPRFPMLIEALTPERCGGKFQLIDQEQCVLPVTPRFMKQWELLAISGGRPVAIFSEWHEEHLMPIGVIATDGGYHALA